MFQDVSRGLTQNTPHFPMFFPWFSHLPQVARRVAAERGEALGGSVGYAVRFDAVRWPGVARWSPKGPRDGDLYYLLVNDLNYPDG